MTNLVDDDELVGKTVAHIVRSLYTKQIGIIFTDKTYSVISINSHYYSEDDDLEFIRSDSDNLLHNEIDEWIRQNLK